MNILTFDIEEWYIEQAFHGARSEKYREFDTYLSSILDLLEKEGKRATFFCLGKIASLFPDVVKRIASRGHEIGCHSDKHLWITKMTPKEFLGDTQAAIDSLEQCIGTKVLSYRAPAFSIGLANASAFETLAQCGIERDASVFPAARDFGGFADFGTQKPCIIKSPGMELKEFPIPLATFFGHKMAYSGGGYFRFFPLSFVRHEMQAADYSMTYFHIRDLLPDRTGLLSREDYEHYFLERGTLFNRGKRYVKSNLGKKSANQKLMQLIGETDFVDVAQADREIDWKSAEVIDLKKFTGATSEYSS